jgi:cathepsin L
MIEAFLDSFHEAGGWPLYKPPGILLKVLNQEGKEQTIQPPTFISHTYNSITAATMASYIANKPLITAALTFLAVLAIANCISSAVAARDLSSSGYGEEAMTARHEKWMAEHGRTYKDEAEKARRFKVFKANVAFVDTSNAAAGGMKYHLAINRFADMTHDEFMARYTGFKPVPATGKKMPGFKYENVTLSDDQQAVDWRKKGAVTDVKNQEQCGKHILLV